MVSRRVLLGAGAGGLVVVAGAGFGLVEADVLPGRGPMHRAFGWDGPDTELPSVDRGKHVDGSFRSKAMGRTVRWRVSYPPGIIASAELPVVVAMHGKGGDYRTAFDLLGADRYQTVAVDYGVQPFAVASVDGGADSYWHRRKNGTDPQEMVRTELLPALADRGLQTKRIGLVGWSMGGYGALLFAERFPSMVAGVAAISPALWRDYPDAAPGAFDGAADFRRNDVFAHVKALRGVRVRVDCGDVDPFVDTVNAFRAKLHDPGGGITEGGHNEYYWRRAMPGALGYLGDALTTGP